MPSHYGCSSKEEKTAYGVGLRQMDYVPFRIEPGYGGICSQEAVVTVRSRCIAYGTLWNAYQHQEVHRLLRLPHRVPAPERLGSH